MADYTVKFEIIDYIIFAITVVVSIGIGVFFGFRRKKNTTSEYLLGNRNLQIIPVGISLLVSFLSTITVIGYSTEVCYFAGLFLIGIPASHIVCPIVVAYQLVPMFHSLKLVSVNEYIQRRYNSTMLKNVGTGLQISISIGMNSAALYGPATLMEAAAGVPVSVSLLLIGVASTLYTTIGGFKAVIWSDVFQAVIMFGSLISIIGIGCYEIGGFAETWAIYNKAGRFNWSFKPSDRLNVFNVPVHQFINFVILFGVCQPAVQRFSSLGSIKDAQRSVISVIPIGVLMVFLATFSGVVAFSYFEQIGCDPLLSDQITNPNQIVAHLVLTGLRYPSLPGLFIACIFCATLSNLSSGYSSCAAMLWDDVLKNHFGHLSESRKTLFTKIIVACSGVVTTALGYLAAVVDGSITSSCIGGSLLSFVVTVTIAVGGVLFGEINKPIPMSTHNCSNYGYNVTEAIFTTPLYNQTTEENFYNIERVESFNLTEVQFATSLHNNTVLTTDGGFFNTHALEWGNQFFNISPFWYFCITVCSGCFPALILTLIPVCRNKHGVPQELLLPCVRKYGRADEGTEEAEDIKQHSLVPIMIDDSKLQQDI